MKILDLQILRILVPACIVGLFALSGCKPGAPSSGPVVEAVALTTYSLAPALSWNGTEAADRYEIEIARNSDFSSLFLKDSSPVPRYVAPNGMAPGKYFWRAFSTSAGLRLPGETRGSLEVLSPANVYEVPVGADADAILEMISLASKNTPARVNFPPGGKFRLPAKPVFLELKGASQLVIDGRGSSITFTNPMTGFARLQDCSEVSFCDLVIDHDPTPFSVGVITSVNKETGLITLEVEPGHPDFDAPHMLENWSFCMFLEPDGKGRILDDSPLVPMIKKETLRRMEKGFAVEVTQASMLRVVSVGDRIVQYSRSPGGRSLFAAERSADLAFLRIVNHSISGGHYILLECDGARILGCSSLPRPGKSYGANADGAHIRSSAVGPWIEGCYFEAVGDDGVAIFAKGIAVLAHPLSERVLLEEQFFNLKKGDRMMFFNPRDGRKVGEEVTITEVSQRMNGPEGKPFREVSFTPGLPEPLQFGFPDVWNNDQVFNMTARHRGFVVRRNTFRDIRRYGVIVRAEQGAIEDNQIIGASDSAITLQNEPNVWRNGLHSVGVRITGNRIEHCNFSASARDRGAIHVALRALESVDQRWGNKPTEWKGHQDLTISGNSISDWRGCAISLVNINGLNLQGNRILRQLPSLPGVGPASAVFLDHITNATISENTFEDLQQGTVPVSKGEDVKLRPTQ